MLRASQLLAAENDYLAIIAGVTPKRKSSSVILPVHPKSPIAWQLAPPPYPLSNLFLSRLLSQLIGVIFAQVEHPGFLHGGLESDCLDAQHVWSICCPPNPRLSGSYVQQFYSMISSSSSFSRSLSLSLSPSLPLPPSPSRARSLSMYTSKDISPPLQHPLSRLPTLSLPGFPLPTPTIDFPKYSLLSPTCTHIRVPSLHTRSSGSSASSRRCGGSSCPSPPALAP